MELLFNNHYTVQSMSHLKENQKLLFPLSLLPSVYNCRTIANYETNKLIDASAGRKARIKPGSSSEQEPKHVHKDKETQTRSVRVRGEALRQEKYKYTPAAWERSPWELGLVFCQ